MSTKRRPHPPRCLALAKRFSDAPTCDARRPFALSRPLRSPAAPEGTDWIHEVKRDGYRITAFVRDGRVRLRSRQDVDWTERLPGVVGQVQALGISDAQLDGEVIAVDRNGRDDFNLLQHSLAGRVAAPLKLIAFDLLQLGRRDLRGEPLLERKAALKELVRGDAVLYSTHLCGHGSDVFAAVAREGYEGIVSKRADSTYEAGPSRTWVKTMARLQDDFVAIGWRSPTPGRRGGLLVAKEEGGTLRYAGCVSAGFCREDVDALRAQVRPGGPDAELDGLVVTRGGGGPIVRVAFRGLTAEGFLRHPSFQGLRLDSRQIL